MWTLALILFDLVSIPAMASPDAIPEYDESTWLEDSFRTADLVVVGTPEVAGLRVEKVLLGDVHPSQQLQPGLLRVVPSRFTTGASGVWMLSRTPQGYFGINPTSAPLSVDRWQKLSALPRPARPTPPKNLKETDTGNQIYRTYEKDGRTLNYGTDVSIGPDQVIFSIYEESGRVWMRGFDDAGRLERIAPMPARGRGFFLQFRKGQVWNFEHFLDREQDGLERTYFEDGVRIRDQKEWRRGALNGWSRTWREDGTLEFEANYEDGLRTPIVHYRGKQKSAARLSRNGQSARYSAPRELMGKFHPGMTTTQVSELLRLDFSEADGIAFVGYACDEDLVISFKDHRISEINRMPNGSFCE
jgi:antitoxin component YwqK of YwqJK toxin-antitoxin module